MPTGVLTLSLMDGPPRADNDKAADVPGGAVVSKRRSRYIAFRVRADDPPAFGDVVRAIRRRDDEAWLVEFDGRTGIVRCPHTSRDRTVEMLTGIDRIDDEPVQVRTLGTSGTLRRCRGRFLG